MNGCGEGTATGGWFRPVTREDVAAITRWTQFIVCGVAVAAGLLPHEALAQGFPIAGLDTRVEDVGELMTGNGGLICTGLGVGSGALQMCLSRGEAGIGQLVRSGCGGAMFGATPELQDYMLT